MLSKYPKNYFLLQVMDSCQNLRKYYGQVMKVNFGESHLHENQIDLE